MSNQGKSIAIFSTVFPKIINKSVHYFQRNIKYLRSILPAALTSQIEKSEIEQKLKNFPYSNDVYIEMTKKLVNLGKTNPEDSIALLMTLNPFISNPILYSQFISSIGLDSEDSQIIQRFLQLSSMYIFADTIPSILTFVNHRLSSNLFDSILILIGDIKNPSSENLIFDCREPFKNIFESHWRIIIKKCSVIIGLLSIFDFDNVYSHFVTFIKNINEINAKNIVLFRFIRIPSEKMKDHTILVVADTVKKIRHNIQIFKPLLSYLRYVALQCDDSESLQNIALAKNYALKFDDYRQHTTELEAIIFSKKPNLSIDSFVDFTTKLLSDAQLSTSSKKSSTNDKLKPKVQLRCFLYLLKGSQFDEAFFYRQSEEFPNARLTNLKNRKLMWNPTAPISRIFSVFQPFFEKIDCPSYFLIKSILDNFANRNVEHTISMISLFLLNSSEEKTLVLLTTLSQFRQNFNDTIKATLFTLLQKFSTFSDNPNFSISPPIYNQNSIENSIDTNYSPEPSPFISHIIDHVAESDFYMKKQLPSFHFQRVCLNNKINCSKSKQTSDKIAITLMALLSSFVTTINTPQFIEILIDNASSSQYSVALFSLYVLEHIYFKHNEVQRQICERILKHLENVENSSKSISLLCLLYYLIARNASIQKTNDQFMKKFETIILLHLSSPFLEIRAVCLKLGEIVNKNLFIVNNQRIQKHFSGIKLPNLTFSDVCESSCLLLYSLFYSEVLIKLTSKYSKLIEIINLIEFPLIKFPGKSQKVTESDLFSFQKRILLFILKCRLQLIIFNQFELISNELDSLSYLKCYSIDDPLLSKTDLVDSNNYFKDFFSSLISTITLKNQIELEFEILLMICNTISFFPLSILLSVIPKYLNKFLSTNLNFSSLTNILIILKTISQLPDIQILFTAYPNSFDYYREAFTIFENIIKKTSSVSLNKEAVPLISIYAEIIKNVASAMIRPFDAGLFGSIRAYRPFDFVLNLNWTIEERYRTFIFFEKIIQTDSNSNSQEIELAINGLLKSGPIFRKSSDFKDGYRFIDKSLSQILRFHPFLFNLFSREAINLKTTYFTAICDQFVGSDISIDFDRVLTKKEQKANLDTFSKRSICILLSLIYPQLEKNFEDVCLKFNRRLTILISALTSPSDTSKIEKIYQSKCYVDSLFQNFAFLASDVFDEGMKQIKLGLSSPVASQILSILTKAAKVINLNQKPISFISHLVKLHDSISDSYDQLYSEIFVNFCLNSDENKKLLKLVLFPLKRIDATKIILLALIREYPSDFIPRVIMSTRLSSWLFYSVIHIDHQNLYGIECSINILDKLCESYFSAIENYLPFILHFCLLFQNSYPILSNLLNQIVQKTIKNTNNIVPSFCEYFSPEEIVQWENISLNWFLSCGDLAIAIKSGEIFSQLQYHSIDSIIPICRSILAVFSCPPLKRHSVIFKYPVCGFKMIEKVLQTTKVPTKIMAKLYYFLSTFIGLPDTKIVCAIFSVFSVFVENSEMITMMNLPKLYIDIVKYLNPSNELVAHSTSLFLASIIIHVSDSKIRALTFCLLLPVIYSNLRFGSSADFLITDDILRLITSTQLGGTLPAIIADFIQIHEGPSEFLLKIINDLYVNHLSDIESIGQYYSLMCESFSNPSPIFEIALALFTVSDKEWFIENFIGVIRCACQSKEFGLDLLSAITQNYRGAMFTWKGILSENENKSVNDEFSFSKLVDKLNEVMSDIKKKKKNVVGVMTLNEFESSIPMIPLNKDTLKYNQNEINEVKSMSPQPLTSDLEEYLKLKKLKIKAREPIVAEQNNSIFVKHSISISQENQYEKPNEKIDVDFFIPNDLDEFIERIS